MLKKIIPNILLTVITLTLVLGGLELGVRLIKWRSALTYFDEQAMKTLGDPVPPKGENEYRVFVFGGSSAYGFPVSDRYSISAWLRRSFPHLLPDKNIRVINCGWPGKASVHVLEGVRTVLKYDPDIFIVYSGHNEFTVSNRLFFDNKLYLLNLRLKYASTAYRYLSLRLDRLRKKLLYGSSGHVEKTYREEAIANKVYHKIEVTDKEYESIAREYEKNMKDVIRIAKRHKIDTLFVTLPSNLKDIPPAYSHHQKPLTGDELAEWEIHFESGRQLEAKDLLQSSLEAYERAFAIDGTFAELAYRMASVSEKLGNYGRAKELYILARDLDGQPWRAKSIINEKVKALVEKHGLLIADSVAAFEKISPHEIVGSNIIHDNVHPSIEAQQLITDEILRELSSHDIIAPKTEWQWEKLKGSREGAEKQVWEIDGSDNAYRYILRGLHLWEQKRYERVVEDLQKGLDLMPSYYESLAFLGDAYWRLGKKTEASDSFNRLLDKDATLLRSLLDRYPAIGESYHLTQEVKTKI